MTPALSRGSVRGRRPRLAVALELALIPVGIGLNVLECIGRVRRMLGLLDEGTARAYAEARVRHFCASHSHPGARECVPGRCVSYCGIGYGGMPRSGDGPVSTVPGDVCEECFHLWDLDQPGQAAA